MKNIFSGTFSVQKYYDPNALGSSVEMGKQTLSNAEALEQINQEYLAVQAKMRQLESQDMTADEYSEKWSPLYDRKRELEAMQTEIMNRSANQAKAAHDAFDTAVNNASNVSTEEKTAAISARNAAEQQAKAKHETAVNAVTSSAQQQQKVEAAMNNFEKTKNGALVAALFGLPKNYFDHSGFFNRNGIVDMSSFKSMMVAVKHVVDMDMATPDTRAEWEKIGYNVQGAVMQKSELNRLQAFVDHIRSNPKYRDTLDYIVTFADNTRKGYETVYKEQTDGNLTNMAFEEVTAMKTEKGKLSPAEANAVRALVGDKDKNYFSVNIVDLQGALTRAIIEGGEVVDTIYRNVTGERFDSSNMHRMRVQFRDAVEAHLALIRAATGNTNAGLDALLQNRHKEYIQTIQERLAAGETIVVKPVGNVGFSNGVKNTLSALLGVAVGVGSGGAITLNAYNGRQVEAKDFINVDKDPTFKEKAQYVLGGLANFVLGRNLKLAIGQDDFLRAFDNRIKDQARMILSLTPYQNPETISDPYIRKAYQIAQDGGYIHSEEDLKVFQELLIKNIIDHEARGVSDAKAIWASINPAFLGVHYDRIHAKKTATRLSDANLVEGKITAREKKLENMPGVNVSEDHKTFRIQSPLADYTGAYQGKFPVLMKNQKGELAPIPEVVQHNSPKRLHLTIITNQGNVFYVAEFTDRPAESAASAVAVEKSREVATEMAMTAEAKNLVASRKEFLKETRAGMGDSIYVMTRSPKYANFNKAMNAVGDQDYDKAIAILQNGKTTTEKTLYKMFKDRPEDLVTALTFKYGGRDRTRQGEASANVYKNAHTDGVKNAENRLTTHNKTTAETEQAFRSHARHVPTELSDILSGQALAVSVYATPKGGQHRIDKLSGSITVSNKILDITSVQAKSEIFDRHAVDNQKNLDAVNDFLRKANKPTMNMVTYKAWVVEGQLPIGITPDMVTKEARFIEARAMIQGNMCANKTEAIAYPLLKDQTRPTPPEVDKAPDIATIGSSTVLMESSVNKVNSDLGVTPAILIKKKTPEPEPTKIETTPGFDLATDTTPAASIGTSVAAEAAALPTQVGTVTATVARSTEAAETVKLGLNFAQLKLMRK